MDLDVLLGDLQVGTIRTDSEGRSEFSFRSDYLDEHPRPVLGQYFEDHLTEIQRSRMHLPPFFSNLLPEGGLRELVARRTGVHRDREAHLIAALGEDLPGAVIVRPASLPIEDVADPPPEDVAAGLRTEDALRFSLGRVPLDVEFGDGASSGCLVGVV